MQQFRLSSRVLRGTWTGPRAVPGRGVVRGPAPLVVPGPVVVPWRVVRRTGGDVLDLEQCGAQPLRAVRVTLAGGGLLGLSLPRTVFPGERLRVVLRGLSADGARGAGDALVVLRWFERDGRELLWPIAL